MSLRFDHSAIPDEVKYLPGTNDLTVLTTVLIQATMTVGINRISDASAAEFFTRLRMMEWMTGASRYENGEPAFIQAQDVRSHIGLSTNATVLSTAKFAKFYTERAGEFLRRTYNNSQSEEVVR